jgi:hypothetical protein
MLAAFYNDTPDDAAVVPPPWAPQPLPSTRQRLGWALRDLPSRLRRIAPTARALRDRARIEREFAKGGERRVPSAFDRSTPPGPFQCGLSRSRRFSCETFPLADVREVNKTLGVTINDVFMACVAGGVRRYLERSGSLPDEAMVATMPLAVTPAAERAHPGNYSSVDYVWLQAQIADPLDRLRATSVAAEATKQHFAQTKDADIGAVIELLPERLISSLARANARTKGRFDTFKNWSYPDTGRAGRAHLGAASVAVLHRQITTAPRSTRPSGYWTVHLCVRRRRRCSRHMGTSPRLPDLARRAARGRPCAGDIEPLPRTFDDGHPGALTPTPASFTGLNALVALVHNHKEMAT